MYPEETLVRSFPGARIAPVAIAILLTVIAAPVVRGQAAPAEHAVKAPLASRSLLLDITRADGMLAVVGERGHILTSQDGGKSWTQKDVPTRSTLTGVYFHDRRLGWAVGHDGVILRTTDGGNSWQRVQWAPEDEAPFLDVWFADANRGIAVGAYGRYYSTKDGGVTWTEKTIADEDFHLNQIASSASGRLYIAGESGNALRSEDGGESWKLLSVYYEGSMFGVLPLEGDFVLMFGLRGHLFRSENAGDSWTPVETGVLTMLNGGVRLADGRVVIVGLGGTVLVSDDGGRSFRQVPQSSRAGIQSVVDAGNGQLVLCGEFGVRSLPVTELGKGVGR
jgi:photosystem II stability/assembly factor-like uncharacterized protein